MQVHNLGPLDDSDAPVRLLKKVEKRSASFFQIVARQQHFRPTYKKSQVPVWFPTWSDVFLRILCRSIVKLWCSARPRRYKKWVTKKQRREWFCSQIKKIKTHKALRASEEWTKLSERRKQLANPPPPPALTVHTVWSKPSTGPSG